MEAILKYLDEIPNRMYPGVYDAAQDHNPLSLIFWWRELFHFIGGLILSLISIFVNPWAVVIAVCLTMSLVEFLTDRDWKSFVDVTFWTLGAIAGCYGRFTL